MASNVSIFESAVGEEPGTSHLYIYPRNYAQSTMALRGGTEIKVNMEPLAHIIAAAGVNRIDTMKIDIEGFEDRAEAVHRDGAAQSLAEAHHHGDHPSLALAHRLRPSPTAGRLR